MFTPQLDTHALGDAAWDNGRNRTSTSVISTPQQLPTQPLSTDSLRPFAPIKISTRSPSRQESVASLMALSSPSASSSAILALKGRDESREKTDASQQRAGDGTDAAIYAGMNTLLHEVHASRFGIPDQLPPADHDRTLSAQDGSSAPVSRQHSQDSAHAFAAWQQQQQQSRITALHTAWSQQLGGASTNTTWYRNIASATQMMDEDDEMTDVDETQGFSASFSMSDHRIPQGTSESLASQQGYVLNQHLSHQQQHLQQPLQQQQAGQLPVKHNLYHTINSQLRAAFLARSEMDKRYR